MIPNWVYIVVPIAIVALILLVTSRYFLLWLQAYTTGTRIGIVSLMLMSLRKINPVDVVKCKVMAVQAGLPEFSTDAIEAQYLAGGDSRRVILALIAANRANIELDWNTAAAIDLAGRDIMEAVMVSVNPRVISCPEPEAGHGDTLYGVAKDGIQLKVRVRVTVRTNMSQLVGGATESTVIARVGQSIISAIGSCESYRDAIGDPMVITRQVLAMGLDHNTAYAIVSVDIADIDVGVNIGAKLRIDQAQAEIRVARAEAEKRRAMAIAKQGEMIALVARNRAKLVLAQAEIPRGMSAAFRDGHLQPIVDSGLELSLCTELAESPYYQSFSRHNQWT